MRAGVIARRPSNEEFSKKNPESSKSFRRTENFSKLLRKLFEESHKASKTFRRKSRSFENFSKVKRELFFSHAFVMNLSELQAENDVDKIFMFSGLLTLRWRRRSNPQSSSPFVRISSSVSTSTAILISTLLLCFCHYFCVSLFVFFEELVAF